MTIAKEMLTVENRLGEREQYDATRIRDVINWACNGVNVNPLELEAHFDQVLFDGIKTTTIQERLVNGCVSLCDKFYPDWTIVAGRLKMWEIWQNCKKAGISYDDPHSLLQYILDGLGNNQYRNILYRYSNKDLTTALKWIVPERDLDFDYAGVVLLESRYLLPNELPQLMFLVNALIIATGEDVEFRRLPFAKRVYEQLSTRKLSLATPFLANLRIPHGNASSCFIIDIDDNLEAIYRELTNAARISKNGGGIGARVSRIRATGSAVMGRPNSSGGIIPWVKLLNDTAIAVNQGKQICPLAA